MKTITRITEVINAMNDAPSGSFVGITDYVTSKGDVVSIIGQVGFDYLKLKDLNTERLQALVDANDFQPITVNGQCRKKDGEFNARSKTGEFIQYHKKFTADEVKAQAEILLAKSLAPAKPRKSNKTALTNKQGGLSIFEETGNFNFTLLIQNETYKEEKSLEAKDGMEVKQKSKHPDTALNEEIRKLYEKTIKSFTIAEGKFKSISLNKQRFASDTITL